jgi:hypothetical protein
VLIQAGCDVHLHWTPVAGSVGYRIYKAQWIGLNLIGGFLNQVGAGQTSYADPAGNGDWWYAVAAIDGANHEISFTGYRQIVLNNCQNPQPPQQVALQLLEFVPAGKDIRCSIGAGPPGAKVKKQSVKMVEGQELLTFPARLDAPVGVRFECIDWGLQPSQIFGSHEKKFYANDVKNNQVIYRGVGYSLLGGAFEIKYRLCLTPCPPVDKNAPVTTGAPETPTPPPGAFPPPTNLAWADDPGDPTKTILSWDWAAPAAINPNTVNFRVIQFEKGPAIPGGVTGSFVTIWQADKKATLSKQKLENIQCKHASQVIVLVKGPGPNDFSWSEPFAYKQLNCSGKVVVNFGNLTVGNLKDGPPGDNTLEVTKAFFFANQERVEWNLPLPGTVIQNGVNNLNVQPITVDLNENEDVNIVVQLFDAEDETTQNPVQVIWCFPKTAVPATKWVGGIAYTDTMQPSAAFTDERNKLNPPVQADCALEVTVQAQ